MRARARVVVERDGARCVVRELRSEAPLTLVPQRGAVATGADAVTVHMVGSATTPLGGDDVALDVVVGPGAAVVVTGVAAALALPGAGGRSRLAVHLDVADGASAQYLPEPTVVTGRAAHDTTLDVRLGADARMRCREVLVAGRCGEAGGSLRSHVRVADARGPLLVQELELGDPALHASPAYLAGHRVIGTEVLVWGEDPDTGASGDMWSLMPLARRGCLATAVGPDAVTTQRDLALALAAHPGWTATVTGGVAGVR
ncbi:urease accessory protein UreD [Pseudonocardia sp.]|uniref:urease accessory protein UreD n=1 Tax=Pseudonocardia sp. TaxID=60912 RepID=UPI003D0C253F